MSKKRELYIYTRLKQNVSFFFNNWLIRLPKKSIRLFDIETHVLKFAVPEIVTMKAGY